MLTRSWPRKMFGFVWKSCRPKLAALGSSSTKCHSCFPFRRDRPLKSSCLPHTWWLTASLKLTGRQCGCRSLAIAQSQALARHFCKYYQRNRVKINVGKYLHNVWVLKVVWWEDLELEFEWDMRASLRPWILRIFVLVLIVYQVWDNVGLADIDQEGVSDDYGALKFGKSTVSFSQIFDFILSIQRITLDEELTTLVVVATAHHRVDWRHILAGLRVVWVVHWNDEIVHLFLEHLLASGILNITSGCPSAIVWWILLVISLGSIFDSEVSEAIEFLPSWAILVSYQKLSVEVVILLLWQDTFWVD